jgi:ATP-binding cassette subfamily B protein
MDTKTVMERNMPGARRHNRFGPVEKPKDAKGTFKRIAGYFVNEKGLVLLLMVLVFAGTACAVLAPARQSVAVDIIAGQNDASFFKTIFVMLALYLGYSICQLFQSLVCAVLSLNIVKKMRMQLFETILDLPVSYLDQHAHGDVMSCMSNDVENISMTISQSLPSLFGGVLMIIGTICIMLYYCWQLTLLSLATILLTVVSSKILSKKVRSYSRKRQAYLGELNGNIEEMITGYKTMVAYNRQEASSREFFATADKLTKAGIRTDIFSGIMGPVTNCIGNIGFVIITVFGGYFAYKGMISVGVISAFIVYARQFSRPINEIAQIYGQFQTALASAERVFAILDENKESDAGKELVLDKPAAIEFKNVYFGYAKDKDVIHNFSLRVPSAKKVALVGATGSGKTTIVNLLMRFYEIDSGTIEINGQDIAQISKSSLRKNMAIVLQDTTLFTDTIYQNLIYANEHATKEEVEKAAALSHCKELIEQQPKGYNSMLVKAGSMLSYGQKQLLAIARAFVADPKILILDEATSNVDTRTEKLIQSAMQKIMANRTSIVIAHRLSTIRDSDLIVVMDQGQIVEQGNHEELLALKGKYYELYEMQFKGLSI